MDLKKERNKNNIKILIVSMCMIACALWALHSCNDTIVNIDVDVKSKPTND
jgi:uncharacterized protein with PQ loop repeat